MIPELPVRALWVGTEIDEVGPGLVGEHLRVARALDEMPDAQRALEEGEVSMSAVRILATAHDVDPEAFRRAEGQLVEAARIHSAGDLHRVTASAITGAAEKDVTPEQRKAAKPVNFGVLYGQGARGLRATAWSDYGLDMSLAEAERARAALGEAGYDRVEVDKYVRGLLEENAALRRDIETGRAVQRNGAGALRPPSPTFPIRK